MGLVKKLSRRKRANDLAASVDAIAEWFGFDSLFAGQCLCRPALNKILKRGA